MFVTVCARSRLAPDEATSERTPRCLGMESARYEAKCAELRELQATFDDFQATSGQIEEELDKELKEANRNVSALQTANRNLEEAVKRLKGDLASQREADSRSVATSVKEVDALREEQAALKKSLHKAESHNETLTERLRASVASVADLQDQLVHQQEETIFAQQELEEARASDSGMIFVHDAG